MGDKDERVTVRVSEEEKRELEDESVNTSGLFRSLYRNYRLAGDTVEAGLKRRLKDEEGDLERLRMERARIESDIDAKQRTIDELQDKIKQRQKSVPEPVIEFAQRVRDDKFPESNVEADNPAIQTQADNAGLPPERFVREVLDRL